MKYRVSIALLSTTSAFVWAMGCIQPISPGLDVGGGGPVNSTFEAGSSDASSAPTGPEVPIPSVCSSLQECLLLCQSPLCTQSDGGIEPAFDTPVIFEADGGTTATSCDQIEEESMTIRTNSCTPCHTVDNLGSMNFILNDSMLTTTVAFGVMGPDGGPQMLVTPGDPADSYVYRRVVAGLASNGGTTTEPALGMPPAPAIKLASYAGPDAAAAIIYPSASDVSVLYEWILCLGQDGGAPSASEYGAGPGYGPEADGATGDGG